MILHTILSPSLILILESMVSRIRKNCLSYESFCLRIPGNDQLLGIILSGFPSSNICCAEHLKDCLSVWCITMRPAGFLAP